MIVVSRLEDFAHIIKARRESLNLSQTRLDDLTGVQGGYTAKIECGMKGVGKVSLPLYLQALGISLHVVFDEAMKPAKRETSVGQAKSEKRLTDQDRMILSLHDQHMSFAAIARELGLPNNGTVDRAVRKWRPGERSHRKKPKAHPLCSCAICGVGFFSNTPRMQTICSSSCRGMAVKLGFRNAAIARQERGESSVSLQRVES